MQWFYLSSSGMCIGGGESVWDGGWASIVAASQTLLLSSLDDCVQCSEGSRHGLGGLGFTYKQLLLV